MTSRARLLRLPLLVVGLGVALLLSRHWPSDHTLRIVLGDAAPSVRELRIRYGEAGATAAAAGKEDWLREVAFHYAAGHTPRIVSHEPRLASGDYELELELDLAAALPVPKDAVRTVTLTRHVKLADDPVSVDVSSAVRDALEEAKSTMPPSASSANPPTYP